MNAEIFLYQAPSPENAGSGASYVPGVGNADNSLILWDSMSPFKSYATSFNSALN